MDLLPFILLKCMNVNNDSKTICKSVFKNGENTISRSQFTKKWIELINRLERNKNVNSRKKS